MEKDVIKKIFERFNEPIIPEASIERWINKFDKTDKTAALMLLDQIEFHSQPRLIRETKALHARVIKRLDAGGFDAEKLSDVDYSREFTCKSGDVVSYLYRKSNLIPTVDFKTFDWLSAQTAADPGRFKDRALVILDDYIGTGSQFIFQFIGRSEDDIRVMNSFKKVYLASYIIHESALEKFWMLADGLIDDVIRVEEKQFPDVDMSSDEDDLRKALSLLDWRNIELIYLDVDYPILSDANRSLSRQEKEEISRLIRAFSHEGYSGTSFLEGHHTFFYGAPNSLPEILWPLFKRVEDLSVYTRGTEKIIEQTGEVVRYNIDEEA
ncbi:MAG TPA: hypothetical protein VIS94_00865 [Desulfomonilia bacterium]